MKIDVSESGESTIVRATIPRVKKDIFHGDIAERRHSVRKKADVHALIYVDSLPVAWGRILNVSGDAIFMECAPYQFARNERLQIEAFASGGSRGSFHNCFIVRTDKRGLVLAFADESLPRRGEPTYFWFSNPNFRETVATI